MSASLKSRRLRRCLGVLAAAVALSAQLPKQAQAEPSVVKPTWKRMSGHGSRHAGFWEISEPTSFEAFNGARVSVFPSSAQPARVRLMSDRQNMMIDGKLHKLALIYIDRGRAEIDTRAPEAHALVLSGQRGIALSYGGKLEALVEGQYASFANLSGHVLTSTGKRYAALGLSRIRSFNSAIPEGTESALLPAPTVNAERCLYVSTTAPVQLGRLSWNAPEKAKGFEVSVTGQDVDYSVETTQLKLPSIPVALGPGRYQTRVAAIDGFGHRGVPSAPLAIRVVGVDLPPGAYVDRRGVIRLGESQALHFTAAEGLRLTRGARSPYTDAQSAIGLLGGDTTYVHLRVPQTNELLTAKLAPRGIIADVQLSPRLATWPRDDVSVRVILKNAEGGQVPSFVQPRLNATLGIDPIALDWQRKGAAFVASVPKPTTPGPWVVRVQVDDQYGIDLGRGVLEIIESQPNSRRKR